MAHNAVVLAASVLACVVALSGQAPDSSTGFTKAQAQAGRLAYESSCGKCHTPSLLGRSGAANEVPSLSSLSVVYQNFIAQSGYVPPLAGPVFPVRWRARTAAQLIARLQEAVPAFPPTGMNDRSAVEITAYVLKMNGAQPGTVPLTRSSGATVSAFFAERAKQ